VSLAFQMVSIFRLDEESVDLNSCRVSVVPGKEGPQGRKMLGGPAGGQPGWWYETTQSFRRESQAWK
jgi:hypothetical protein